MKYNLETEAKTLRPRQKFLEVKTIIFASRPVLTSLIYIKKVVVILLWSVNFFLTEINILHIKYVKEYT